MVGGCEVLPGVRRAGLKMGAVNSLSQEVFSRAKTAVGVAGHGEETCGGKKARLAFLQRRGDVSVGLPEAAIG